MTKRLEDKLLHNLCWIKKKKVNVTLLKHNVWGIGDFQVSCCGTERSVAQLLIHL